jgi:DUF1365 family protein
MSELHSALYVGRVSHERLRPKRHRLAYRVFSLLVDIDELETLDRSLRLFSLNAFNLFSLRPRDYGFGQSGDLRDEVQSVLGAAGIDLGRGPIRLLTMPRVLGYAFNPLSIFFCHERDGALGAILYQVNNTFGERHTYLVETQGANRGPLTHEGCKRFYVSPFLGLDMVYRFRIQAPGELFSLDIEASDSGGPILHAAQKLRRAPLSDLSLLRVFFTHPLMTAKVIAGIHWEALLLWLKGAPLQSRPPPPAQAVSRIPAYEKP